jgi:hypothetical protein
VGADHSRLCPHFLGVLPLAAPLLALGLSCNDLRAVLRNNPGEQSTSRKKALTRISHQGSGRAGLQPRRYKAFLIIPASRVPSSLQPQAARDTGPTESGSRDFGGAEAPPFRQPT